jgi:hypothetical protein
VSGENQAVVVLVVMPVFAAVWLGLLARAFVEGGGNRWPLWLVLLVATGVIWYSVFTGTP